MRKLLGRDSNGNYATMDDDGKIGVYNYEHRLVNQEGAARLLRELGFEVKFEHGRMLVGILRGGCT